MSYRPRYLSKRLPSYTGFVVMLLAIGITVVLSKNSFSFVSKATVGATPKNVLISNVSPTSFTLSYTTDAPALGSLGYGSDPSSAAVTLDDRDKQASKPTEHQVHYFTVKNLSPATTYYYLIQSGDQHVDDNGKPFQISTPASSSAQTSSPTTTMTGTVAAADGSTPPEAIVTVSTDGSQQLSALVGSDGTYQIPLNGMLTSDYTAPATVNADTVYNVQAGNGAQQSTVKVIASQASQVPKITLSQNYNFTLNPDANASDSGSVASGSSLPLIATPIPATAPEITSPKDAQKYSNQQPTFTGRALPNESVSITIHSDQEISAQIQTDSSGSWQFKPPVQLSPGNHTVTIQSIDASGALQKVSKAFTVYAAGSKFVEPSVSPIQVSPSPVASASPTLVPTAIPSPTASPSPTLTPTLAVTVPPARGTMPPTGSSVVMTGIIGGVIAIGIGALLFIFTAI